MSRAVKSSSGATLAIPLCATLVFPFAAQAKWKAAYADDPGNAATWYSAQQNAKGEYCCDKSDGHAFYGDYTLEANGDVEFVSSGTRYHLPAYMVLKGPNPTGHAVWWYDVEVDGRHIDFCFATGAGG